MQRFRTFLRFGVENAWLTKSGTGTIRTKRKTTAEEDERHGLELLEGELGWSFQVMKRSAACRVVRSDVGGGAQVFIQHGQPCKRTPSLEGTRSTCTFFRAERTDSVVYVPAQNELRINASRSAELRLDRAKFGLHLSGDAENFAYAEKHTLRPLQQRGRAALFCRDIGGMDAV